MKRTKRTYHNTEEALYRRLKLTILGILVIPTSVLLLFIFFGPALGSLFGIVSINRNADIDLDIVAPPKPVFDNPPTATNSNNITLRGFSEEGATIKLLVNGQETQTTVTATDGTFTFENISLINGRNKISALAVDNSKNESENSDTIFIEHDTQAPEIKIESPKDKEVVRNLNKRVIIKGKVSKKSTIKINDKLAILRPDLSFEFSLGVEGGENKIKVEAVDTAGNTKTEEFKITYVQAQ